MLRFALRNVFRQATRTLLTLAAIAIGVASLILSGGFIEDMFVQLREATIHSRLGHLQTSAAGYTTFGRRDPYQYLMPDPEPVVQATQGWPEVVDVMRRVSFDGLASNGRADLPIVGEGVEPAPEARLGTFLSITDGRNLEEGDALGVLVGQGVARALKLAPGDFLTLLVNTPGGALNSLELEVVGVFRSFSRDYDNRAVRITLAAANELLASEGVHSVVLALAETDQTDAVADRLRQALDADRFEVRTWHALAEFYQKTVDLYRRQFGVLQLIILVMVLLSVANSINMALYERTGEFGTLMAVGNRRRDVFRLAMVESLVLGVLGAGAGVLIGVGIAWAASTIGIPMPPPPNADTGYTAYIRIVPEVVAWAFGYGACATVLAALLPARRASRLPVVEALRFNV
jgi:putative ABC transport system permease protein